MKLMLLKTLITSKLGLAALALVAALAAGWYVADMRSDLSETRELLEQETLRASAAEKGAEAAARQAEQLVASRDKAHAQRLDAIERIHSAEDKCVGELLPAELLDR